MVKHWHLTYSTFALKHDSMFSNKALRMDLTTIVVGIGW
jgi:hypothetical protein